nr:MAG: nonstructural protein [Microvirus sp.]
MELHCYSLLDQVLNTFSYPFPASSDNEARRNVRLAALDAQTTLHKSPSDFTLYKIGVFDNDTGEFRSLATPLLLDRVTSLISNNEVHP